MYTRKKMFHHLRISSVFVLLFVVHLVQCSSIGKNEASSTDHGTMKQQVNARKASHMKLHGILLWASMGLLMPIGILVIRMSSTEDSHPARRKILFYIHAVVQVFAVLIATFGAVLSIRHFENAFDNTHQRIGLALYAAIYVQVLIALRRPKRGTRVRTVWYFMHWILGTTISLVGILNVYTGLQAYHKRTSKGTSLWSIIFTAEVSFMAVLYLFQDKWEYLQKQGMISHDDPITSPGRVNPESDSQKRVSLELCRKSNALGTHFSRTNALNKLFQLT